jgi:hypothetical protein
MLGARQSQQSGASGEAVIDHDPGRADDDMSAKAMRFTATMLRYQALFGERASAPIWEYPEAIAILRETLPVLASEPMSAHVSSAVNGSSSSSSGRGGSRGTGVQQATPRTSLEHKHRL